ncbi:MAG: PLP-dependent transferase, partial [Chloroflexi bacterium]|nr:PLP-dependent transferase [Chloroflexota bacterium]
MEFSTRAIHAGQEPDETTGAAIPPIHLSTIYAYESPGVTRGGFEYIRYGNPTRAALEACLASLENAPEDCPALCFSSGMAATDAAMRLLRPGDRLLLASEIYGGTFRLAEEFLRPAGIIPTYFDATDPGGFEQAFAPGIRMVW